MEMETVFDLLPEYTESSLEPETSPALEFLDSSAFIEESGSGESGSFVETDSMELEPVSKEEWALASLEDESREALSPETDADIPESEIASSPEDKETILSYPAVGSASDVSGLLDQMDDLAFSEMAPESVMDWQTNLATCRASLASCVSLLSFADILLCLLLGCLCTSIFSRFWKLNR